MLLIIPLLSSAAPTAGQRRRRWPAVGAALGQRSTFTWLRVQQQHHRGSRVQIRSLAAGYPPHQPLLTPGRAS